jgi:hypothetical protein
MHDRRTLTPHTSQLSNQPWLGLETYAAQRSHPEHIAQCLSGTTLLILENTSCNTSAIQTVQRRFFHSGQGQPRQVILSKNIHSSTDHSIR